MLLAVDFETHLISEAAPFPKPVCLSYATEGGEPGLAVGSEMEQTLIWALKKGPIIAHNAVFECGVIYFHFPALRPLLLEALEEGRIVCTKIAEELIDNLREKQVRRYSLADLVKNYFKTDISATKKDPDAWRTNYDKLEGVPKEEWPVEAVEYAIEDSVWALKCFKKQQKLDQRLDLKASVYLNLMAAKGMLIDQDRVQQLEDEVSAKLKPHYDALVEQGFCVPVKNKPRPKKNMKVLKEYIEENIPDLEYTSKGSISTSFESMAKYYLHTKDPIIEHFQQIATYEKVISAFTSNLKAPIVRTSYSTTKSTGRTSASKSRFYPSVNIQQMPREVPDVTWDIRNCFIPKEGHKIVSIDYSGLELTSTAHQLYSFYGKSKMRDTVNEGEKPVDMHSKLACRLMSKAQRRQVSYDEFISHKKEAEYKHFRQLSKPINLGFPGGIGYDTMRTLLLKDNIDLGYRVVEKSPSEQFLRRLMFQYEYLTCDLRVKRLFKREFALVYDELIDVKRELFGLYPELEEFLKEGHKEFLTGETKWMKNDFDEWEEEPMYRYIIKRPFGMEGFMRDWCTYTAICNGFLMQSPAAVGAKLAMSDIIGKYLEHPDMEPLAFIHDEIVFSCPEDRKDIVEDVAMRLINNMQKVLTSVRVTVEAEMMDYWAKSGGFWSKLYWKDPQ